jgi:hypothetical protein
VQNAADVSVRKHVKYLFFAIVLISISQITFARSIEVCPTLPDESDLVWIYQEGIDFDICYAVHSETEATAFGIYMGGYPSFKLVEGVKIETGIVATKKITWYQMEAEESPLVPARQTLMLINEQDEWFAHIWIVPESNEELQTSISILKRIVFREY